MATIMDIYGAKLWNDSRGDSFEVTFPKNGISESDFSKIIPIIVNVASIKAKNANNGSAVSDDDRVYKTAKSTSTDNITITVTATKLNDGKYNKAEFSDYVSALKADVVQTSTPNGAQQQQTPNGAQQQQTPNGAQQQQTPNGAQQQQTPNGAQQQTPTPSIEDQVRGAVLDAFKPLFDKDENFKNKFMSIFDTGTSSNNH